MRYAPLLALAAILPLSACAIVPNAGPIVDSPHEIAQQGSLVPLLQPVQVGSVVATPMRVTEDSRCPMNARCVWAGRAVVETRMRELFDARLNIDDTPMSQAALVEAVKTADVLVPTVTDRIDAKIIAQAGDQLTGGIQVWSLMPL